jgi:hypothetical protein
MTNITKLTLSPEREEALSRESQRKARFRRGTPILEVRDKTGRIFPIDEDGVEIVDLEQYQFNYIKTHYPHHFLPKKRK